MRNMLYLVVAGTFVFYGCQESGEKPKLGESQKEPEKVSIQKTAEPKKTEEPEKKAESIAKNGEAIFKAKGCSSCHQPAVDTVGPSLQKISKAYNGDKEKLTNFLKGKSSPIMDTEKFSIMKPQLTVTSSMSDKDLQLLVDYILKH